jgi:hypothetical protein
VTPSMAASISFATSACWRISNRLGYAISFFALTVSRRLSAWTAVAKLMAKILDLLKLTPHLIGDFLLLQATPAARQLAIQLR